MRKILLIFALLTCVICPAKADIAAGATSANCDSSTLGTTSGSVDFESLWTAATYTITLNDSSNGGSGGSGSIKEVYSTKWTTSSGTTTSSVTVPTKANATFAGYYNSASGSTQYINSSGTITAGNTTFTANTTIYAQFTCKAGYYLNGTTCTACAAGTYKASAGNGGCTGASAGYYASGTGNTSQTACAAGTYSTGSASSCTTITTGYYNTGCGTSATGGVCSTSYSGGQCPSGYRNIAATSQNACVGTFSKSGSQLDPTQPSSWYSRSLSACTPGSCNFTKNYAGTTINDCTPTNCTKGQTATACKSGYYLSSGDCSACSGLASGFYPNSANGNSTGAGACYTNSISGKYVASANATSATNCGGNNKYKAAHNVYYGSTSSCSDVSSGYYTTGGDANTRTGQTACEAGYYCSGGVRNVCGGGTYSTGTATSCSSITAGYYNNGGGTSATGACLSGYTCGQCPSGYRNVVATSQNACVGTFSKSGSQLDPTQPSSWYSRSLSACTPGSCNYTKNYGGSIVSDCTPTNCTKGQTATACKSGYYLSSGDCPACSGLASGFYPNSANGNSTGAGACYTNSISGKYVASANATGATNCGSNAKYKAAHNVYYGGTSSCSDVTAGYYTTGGDANTRTGQSACGGNAYYCSGGVRNNVSSGYYSTGGDANTRTGQSQCTGSTYCSSGVQTNCPSADSGWTLGTGTGWTARTSCYEYQTPSNCASGSVKRNGDSSSNAYASTITLNSTLKAKANYYTTTTATSCTACPTAYPNSAADTNSGQGACYKTCSSGNYWNGTNQACAACTAGNWCAGTTAYYTTTSNQGLSACSSLGSGYTSAGGTGDTANTKCYLTLEGKVRSGTSGTTTTNCNSGKYKASHNEYYGSSYSCDTCSAGTYSTTSGAIASCSACTGRTKYSGSGASSCSTVSSGYYTTGCNGSGNNCTGQTQCSGRNQYCSSGVANTVSGGYYSTGCNSSNNQCTGQSQCTGSTYCASGVQNNCPSADSGWTLGTGTGWTARTSCYEYQTPSNCSSGSVKRNGNSDANSYSSTITLNSTLKAKANYYTTTSATSCTACPSAYPNSAADTNSGQSACYKSCSAGYYWNGTNQACTACTAGNWCTATTNYYTTTSNKGLNSCASNLGTGYTSAGGTGDTANTKCYLTLEGKVRSGTSGTTTANCNSGKYKASHNEYYGSSYSCDTCAAGTYSTTSGAIASCSACTGRTQYSGSGASSCSTVSGGYYTTGCNGSGNNCTGQSQCTGRTKYCSSGVENTVSSGYYTTGCSSNNGCTGQQQCTGSTYCSGGVQTSCPSADSGWTLGTGTGWTARTSCYEYQTPSNCSSGSVKRNGNSDANSYSSTITLNSTLKAKANYYTTTTATSCTACPSAYPNSAADTNSGQSACYKSCGAGYYWNGTNQACTACTAGNWCTATTNYYTTTSNKGLNSCASNLGTGYTSAGGTGDTANTKCYLTLEGKVRSGTSGTTTTNCNSGKYKASHNEYYGSSYSCDTCAAGTYSTTSGAIASCSACTGRTQYSGSGASSCSTVSSGYYTTGCTSNNNCTGQSACGGNAYYCSGGVRNDVSSGYYTTGGDANTHTGQTQCEAGNYCSGGVKTACPNANTYKRTTFPSNYYSPTISSTSVSSGKGITAATQCYVLSWMDSARGSLYEYVYYNSSSGKYDGTTISYGWHKVSAGYYLTTKAGCGAYAYYSEVKDCPAGSYCPGKNTVECNTNNQATVHTTNFGLESCPTAYPNSAANTTTINNCYLTLSAGYRVASAKAGATACPGGTYSTSTSAVYYDGSGHTTTSSCSNITAGYYSSGGGTSATGTCLSGYSCGGCSGRTKYSGAGASSCSTVDSGYYTTGCNSSGNLCTGESQCGSGTWCASGVANNCSSLSGVSPSGGTYSSAAGSTANTACKYTAPSKTITGCKTVTSQAVTYSGSAWPASTYGVTATTGYVIANNNSSSATCSKCSAGTYQGTDGSTATSCSACEGRTKYSGAGAASCSTVSSGYYTTGCNSSNNNCTGQSQCTAGYYCSGGVAAACGAGKYSSTAGATSCSNVTAGYFCAGGAKTATPSSSSDSVTGASCGTCINKNGSNGRPLYTDGAGASACSECPAVTGTLASRATGEYAYYPATRGSGVSSCYAYFTDSDDSATFPTLCYHGSGDYGDSNSSCQIYAPSACAAGKYSTIASTSEWSSSGSYAACKGVDCMKGKVCTNTTAGYYSANGATTQTACATGSYSSSGSGTCTACPGGRTTAGTGTAFNTDANTTCSTSCSSIANLNSWATPSWSANTVSNLCTVGTCAAGSYKSSNTCPVCGDNKYSDAGASSCSSCGTSNGYGNSGTTAAAHAGVTSCKVTCSAGTYVSAASGACGDVGDGYYRAGNETVSQGSTGTRNACSSLKSEYTHSDSGRDASTDCYLNTTSTKYVASANSNQTACASGSYCPGSVKVYYGSTGGSTSCTSPYSSSAASSDDANDCYLTTSAGNYVATAGEGQVTCASNGYCPGGSTIYKGGSVNGRLTTGGRTACTSPYGSASTGQDDANDCYLTTTAGNYVATAGAGQVTCASNGYCPGGSTIYKGGSVSGRSTSGGRTACASPYSSASTGQDDANDCYLTTSAKKYVASAGTGETDCPAGYYCSGGSTIYKGGTVSGRSTTGGITQCPSGSYCVAKVSSATSCTAPYSSSAAGSDDANDCYLTTSAKKYVASTGGGETTCPAGYYCSGGSVIYVGGSVSGRSTTGGATSCPSGSYCESGVSTATTCSSGTSSKYTLSAANSTSINDCYLTLTAGNYVASAGAGATTCASGGYCASTSNIYYGGTHTSSHLTSGGWTACGAGTYNGNTGSKASSACTVCSGNTYATTTGSSSCGSSCPSGYSISGTTAADHDQKSDCKITCNAGYAVLTGDATCSSIQTASYKGKYIGSNTISAGSTSTISTCPTNYQAANGTTAQSNCETSCSAGTAVQGTNEACSTVTTANKYTSAHNVKYGNTSTLSTCNTTNGYGNSGSTAADHANQSSCKTTCAAGKQVATASAACSTPTGSWYTSSHTVSEGSTSGTNVTSCVNGNYTTPNTSTQTDHDASSDCKTTCSAGNYVASANGACTAVTTDNKYTVQHSVSQGDTSSLSSCNTTNGYTNSGTTAAAHANQSSCKTTCNAGTYVASAGTACGDVGNGYYRATSETVSEGSTGSRDACSDLKSEYTNSDSGRDASTDCYLNTTSTKFVKTANANQVTCDAGGYCAGGTKVYYGSTGGRTACSAGTYNAGTGSSASSACVACATGSYSSGTGNTACTACAAGKTNSNTGNTSCSSNCDGYGTYVTEWNTTGWSNSPTANSVSNLCSVKTYTTYDITYGCGSKPTGATSTVSGSGPSKGSATYNSTYSLSSSYGGCTLPGYNATGWDCSGGATLTNAKGSQSKLTKGEDIVCNVHWTANSINVNWYQDTAANGVTEPFTTGTCVYDDTLTVPTNYEQKQGYHFNGWELR